MRRETSNQWIGSGGKGDNRIMGWDQGRGRIGISGWGQRKAKGEK